MNKRKFEDLEAECTDTDSTENESDDDCVQLEESDKGKEKEPDVAEPPKKKFRINAKQLSLTYSRCPISKEEVYSQLHKAVGPPIEYLVVQEDHKVEMSISDKRAIMRQNYDQLNARCNYLERLMTKIKHA